MIKIFGHKAPDTDATCSALVWEWAQRAAGKEAKAYVLGKPNTEAAFVLSRWGFDTPALLEAVGEGDDVIIVDTNNPDELPADVNTANILQIIDHHLLVGGIKTRQPIEITIKPLASTATIMAGMLGDALNTAPEAIKGLILSCILSDTLEFRSPTTTQTDIDLAKGLAEDLGLSISEYAAEMFRAKSDISHFSDAELLRLDSKQYGVDDKKFRVSVLETTSPELVLDRQAALVSAMDQVAAEDGVDQVLLFVVDILKEESTLLVPNALVKSLAEASFDVQVAGDLVVLPNVVSRKKQIIPNLKF